jgi:hypothetical protein
MIRNYFTRYLLAAAFFLLILTRAAAQPAPKKDIASRSATMFRFSYAYHIPGGHLAKRFGNSSALGFGLAHKLQSNWIFFADARFLFGGTIKEDSTILDHLKTSNGFLLNSNGQYSTVRFFERGAEAYLGLGKLFPLSRKNKNTGILFRAAGGFLQHKIRIEDIGGQTPPINKEYRKGYDRLTSGFALNGFLGYMRMDRHNLVNFFAGVDFTQGFTKNRRDFNFDTRMRDDTKRRDRLIGLQFGMIIAIYHSSPDQEYFFR